MPNRLRANSDHQIQGQASKTNLAPETSSIATRHVTPDDLIKKSMRQAYRQDEAIIMEMLLPLASLGASSRAQIWQRSRQLIINIRQRQTGKGGVDALLKEFSLSSEEGIVLMCLAEALLRVPDKPTSDRLIRDKLLSGDWGSHLGNSHSMFVNASAWGLLLTGKVMALTNPSDNVNRLKSTISRLGEPVIRASVRYAMQIMGAQFVMGRDINTAISRAEVQEKKGYSYSYDMLGEGARTMADADRYYDAYAKAIKQIGESAYKSNQITKDPNFVARPENQPGISVKLSALHPRYEFAQYERVISELVPRLKSLTLMAKTYDIGFTVDAEEADRLDLSLDVIELVFLDVDLAGWQGFGLAVQAYQKRAIYVVDWACDLARRAERQLMVRLVKGAYWDSEIKSSQVGGFSDYPVFTRKTHTDICYQACVKKMLGNRQFIYPQFATHNAYSVAMVLQIDEESKEQNPRFYRKGYEFQRLHGMGEELFDQILEQDKVACRIYAPVGEHADLLAYLVRRLLENGANSSFVNNIVDDKITVESLIVDPVSRVYELRSSGQEHFRNTAIPKPCDLFRASTLEPGQRINSEGIDLSEISRQNKIVGFLAQWQANSTVDAKAIQILNPAQRNEVVGEVGFTSLIEIENTLTRAHATFSTWSATSVSDRAALLRKLSFILEHNRDELVALCVKEAGKTITDGYSEVREAVDFCRYYADQAESLLEDPALHPRGVLLCISPWNFPLAIFLGQVTAALVTGNTVIAKPAEQTSLIALKVLELMHEAGLPQFVVQLVLSKGQPAGEFLVPDERIKGILFTGSTITSQWINNKLDGRNIPLVAETGGQNVMIVDSTALPEQVVDDVIQSGFLSAGQRCSSLRVLFLQEDIADKISLMIQGAMAELSIGDPALLGTDIGPVIDQSAQDRLHAHQSFLTACDGARLVYACELPEFAKQGFYFPPSLYELDNINLLDGEVFGPIVHIVRYKSSELEQVVEQVNNLGYGLTLGIHSRIESTSQMIANKVRVGNVYINRSMTGAVVGVQPFGGCGLSGTGPKAGGPFYLQVLVDAKPLTTKKPLPTTSNRLPVDLFSGAKRKFPAAPETLYAAPAKPGCDLKQRLDLVHQLMANIVNNVDINRDGCFFIEAETLVQWAQENLSAPIILPGPTGESNQLQFMPRGNLAVFLWQETELTDLLMSVYMSVLTGNATSIFYQQNPSPDLDVLTRLLDLAGLNRFVKLFPLAMIKDAMSAQKIHGVLSHTEQQDHRYIEIVRQSRGEIIPVLNVPNRLQMIASLVIEKTITIDTTAAGGNASLMTLSESV